MKILFVSLFLPMEKSYHAGGRFVYELLRQLSQRHEIHLATRLQEDEYPFLEDLRPFCREIHPWPYPTKTERGLLDKFRLIGNYLGFSRFANRLVREGDYDLVQVEWVETALCIRRGRTPMVLDAHDVITKPAERALLQSTGAGRAAAWVKYRLVRWAESRIAGRFDVVITRSGLDANYLVSLAPGIRTSVVPHPAGLDLTGRSFDREANTVLFFASYRYRQVNVDAALWFYRQVFPLVRQKIPEARFVIAGYGPPECLTELAATDSSVRVTGFVEIPEEYYRRAAVFVAPILAGGGIIVKVLDALAAGTPVVTTTYGNEGIGGASGRELLVADDPKQFAEAVVAILQDRELAERLAENGRSFAAANFGLTAVVTKVEEMYGEMLR
jgi:glycosyltransferase involved in cell wall biosynthesis